MATKLVIHKVLVLNIKLFRIQSSFQVTKEGFSPEQNMFSIHKITSKQPMCFPPCTLYFIKELGDTSFPNSVLGISLIPKTNYRYNILLIKTMGCCGKNKTVKLLTGITRYYGRLPSHNQKEK